MEEWKPIKGFEHRYLISSFGRIMNNNTGNMLLQKTTSKGYLYVNLHMDKGTTKYSVHLLVVETFNSDFNENYDIIHKDGNIINNAYNNLRIEKFPDFLQNMP